MQYQLSFGARSRIGEPFFAQIILCFLDVLEIFIKLKAHARDVTLKLRHHLVQFTLYDHRRKCDIRPRNHFFNDGHALFLRRFRFFFLEHVLMELRFKILHALKIAECFHEFIIQFGKGGFFAFISILLGCIDRVPSFLLLVTGNDVRALLSDIGDSLFHFFFFKFYFFFFCHLFSRRPLVVRKFHLRHDCRFDAETKRGSFGDLCDIHLRSANGVNLMLNKNLRVCV